jgi:hypothetical protein
MIGALAYKTIRKGHMKMSLQAAAYNGDQDIVRLLLDHGADINIQRGKHGNAHQAAVIGQEHQIANLLLDRGADVTGVGSIVFNWLSCITSITSLKKETRDGSADIFLLSLSTFPNHTSGLLISRTCIPPDLHADGSLFLSYEAAIPRLYTDIAETLSRTRLRAWPTTKLQAIACDSRCPIFSGRYVRYTVTACSS